MNRTKEQVKLVIKGSLLIDLVLYVQVEEEDMLVSELKKIELRKKEREKKQKDLQKLISAAEQNADR